MEELSWTPVMKGRIYCSPACGYSCTWESYQKAGTEAELLAKAVGEGWIAHVWENLGWHWKIVSPCGRLRVHPSRSGSREVTSFTAFLGDPVNPGRWAANGKTVPQAITAVIQKGRDSLNEISALLEGL